MQHTRDVQDAEEDTRDRWDKLVAYRVEDKSKSVQLSRALHGYIDRSNKGQYSYLRKGLLDKIPHLQLLQGVLLTRKENINQITQLLKKYQAEYYTATLDQTQKQPTKQ
jgi:hypothetical protein